MSLRERTRPGLFLSWLVVRYCLKSGFGTYEAAEKAGQEDKKQISESTSYRL
jgi:hypothetical protein